MTVGLLTVELTLEMLPLPLVVVPEEPPEPPEEPEELDELLHKSTQAEPFQRFPNVRATQEEPFQRFRVETSENAEPVYLLMLI